MTLKQENYKAGDLRDEMQTPGYAALPLVPFLGQFRVLWEPAVGEGYLARELSKYVDLVLWSDLKTGHDFFDYSPPEWDALVTNPPYASSVKYRWIERCIELERPWALLLPVMTLGAGQFQKAVRGLKPQPGIILMDKRINFKTPNKGWEWVETDPKSKKFGKLVRSSAQFPSMWVTWNMGVPLLHYYSFDWLTNEKRKEYEY